MGSLEEWLPALENSGERYRNRLTDCAGLDKIKDYNGD